MLVRAPPRSTASVVVGPAATDVDVATVVEALAPRSAPLSGFDAGGKFPDTVVGVLPATGPLTDVGTVFEPKVEVVDDTVVGVAVAVGVGVGVAVGVGVGVGVAPGAPEAAAVVQSEPRSGFGD